MAEPAGPNVLTQTEAEDRAAAISDVAYDLTLSLIAGSETYDAEAAIRFSHAAPAAGAFLDFTGREIHSLTVNGVERAARHERNRLYLDGADLAAANEVRVRYTNDYDHIGAGLHQFVDPQDGAEYLYTHFEPYDAHRLLPCFDQPDLKGTYDLTVTAPSAWEVIANYPVAETESVEGGERTRLSLRDHPALQHLPAGARRGSLRALRRPLGRHAARRLLPLLAGRVLRRRRVLRGHPPGPDLLLRLLRLPLPVRQVRPGLRARVQHGRDGERRLYHLLGADDLPRPADRHPAAQPRRGRAARNGPHVVRRPRHDAVVERPLAQRVVRDLHGLPLDGAGHALRIVRLVGLPRADEGLGLRAGPAAHHAPDRRRRARHRRHVPQLRRDHLRQGRGGAQAARRLPRRRGLPRRHA